MTPTEQQVAGSIAETELVELLSELISFESLGGRETPVQECVAEKMTQIGMEVDTWPIDMNELISHPSYSAEIERLDPIGVAASFGEGSGPVLVLNGHTDVVPAGRRERWSSAPFAARVEHGNVYGRGACDMKGGLSCALVAVRSIIDAGVALHGRVIVQSVVGEEDGGTGTLASILRGHTGDAAIVMEPTELMVAPAQGGALSFQITVPGLAAHGGLRTEGISPFDHYVPIYNALREFEAHRNQAVDDPLFDAYDIPFPICIGRLESGIWPSTEAESLVAEGRLGVGTHEDPDIVREQFLSVVTEVAAGDKWLRYHPPTVEWLGAQFHPARTPSDAHIVGCVGEAHASVTGDVPTVRGMTYGADMRLFVHDASMPTVMYGPGDIRRAHAPDEYVPIDDLAVCARTLAVTILRFCGHEPD